ncbi:hypothetical protein KKA23_01075 [Patescibacteria group bacterium]|nr:hypothetical protein [Patescibacteria group bacterium]
MRKDKNKAIILRKKGKSYNEITKLLNIPKSTLSSWLKDIKMSKNVEKELWNKTRKKWAENIIKFNKKRSEIAKEKAQKIQDLESKKIGLVSKRELFLIGTALYWAEGYKKSRWQVVFSNSDPIMVKIIMKFFREIMKINEEKIFATIQTHTNIKEEKALNYWSKITKIPKKRFRKTYKRITPSSKGVRPINTLPYGTIRIVISDVIVINRIKGWITGIGKNI